MLSHVRPFVGIDNIFRTMDANMGNYPHVEYGSSSPAQFYTDGHFKQANKLYLLEYVVAIFNGDPHVSV